jgi:hypothetical protein
MAKPTGTSSTRPSGSTADVASSSLPIDPLAEPGGPQHAVELVSVEDDELNAGLSVIWEVEPRRRAPARTRP